MLEFDKTYTDSYKAYKEYEDWAKNEIIYLSNGYKICVGDWVSHYDDWVSHYEKEHFDNALMSLPFWLSVYVEQNCKSQFILDRINPANKYYQQVKNMNFRDNIPKDFLQNRKILIKRNKRTKFPLYSRPKGGKNKWCLQSTDHFWYNKDTKSFIVYGDYYPPKIQILYFKSIKGVIRHLRKKHLLKGIRFKLIGNKVGEEFFVDVS